MLGSEKKITKEVLEEVKRVAQEQALEWIRTFLKKRFNIYRKLDGKRTTLVGARRPTWSQVIDDLSDQLHKGGCSFEYYFRKNQFPHNQYYQIRSFFHASYQFSKREDVLLLYTLNIAVEDIEKKPIEWLLAQATTIIMTEVKN